MAVGDVSNALKHLDLLQQSSLRAVVFHELLSWDPNKSMVLLAAADQVEKLSNRQPLKLDIRMAAHAPHSISPRLMSGIVKRGGPFAIHLAESPQESAFLMEGGGEWGAFLARRGAGYVGTHEPDFMATSDPWFRGVELNASPDGDVFLADWSDIGECHENDGVHRSTGRIFKLAFDDQGRGTAPGGDGASRGELTSHRGLAPNDYLGTESKYRRISTTS